MNNIIRFSIEEKIPYIRYAAMPTEKEQHFSIAEKPMPITRKVMNGTLHTLISAKTELETFKRMIIKISHI